MKLLNTKLTAVNLKFFISEAQVATVISYGNVETEYSECPPTFVWGRLFNIYLTKHFRRRELETGNSSLC